MNGAELTIEVARQMKCSKKEASKFIDAVFEGIKIGLDKDEKVKVSNFGTFYVHDKKPHDWRNPRTGEIVKVPEKRLPKVRFSELVKDYLNR